MVVKIQSRKEFAALCDVFANLNVHWCVGYKHHVYGSIDRLGKAFIDITFPKRKGSMPYAIPILEGLVSTSIGIQDVRRKIIEESNGSFLL